jgi:hypothetical protein
LSLEDEIAATLDEIDGADNAGAQVATETADGPARDEQGRFSKADDAPDIEAAPADTETTDAQAPEVTPDQGDETAVEAVSQPPIDAPASWSAAAKAEWQTLPRLLQDEVTKRETDVARGFEQYAGKAKAAEALDAVLEPVRPTLSRSGIDEATYVRKLVDWDSYLTTDPKQAIQALAQQFGIDLSAVVNTAAESEPLDPTLAALQNKVAGLEQHLTNDVQTRQQAQFTQVQGQIAEFRDAKDSAGNLKYPYFALVEPHMAELINGKKASGIEIAYEKAVSELLKPIFEVKTAEAQRERQKAEAVKAASAKRIAATNIEGSTAKGATPPATLEEEIGQVVDELGAA